MLWKFSRLRNKKCARLYIRTRRQRRGGRSVMKGSCEGWETHGARRCDFKFARISRKCEHKRMNFIARVSRRATHKVYSVNRCRNQKDCRQFSTSLSFPPFYTLSNDEFVITCRKRRVCILAFIVLNFKSVARTSL